MAVGGVYIFRATLWLLPTNLYCSLSLLSGGFKLVSALSLVPIHIHPNSGVTLSNPNPEESLIQDSGVQQQREEVEMLCLSFGTVYDSHQNGSNSHKPQWKSHKTRELCEHTSGPAVNFKYQTKTQTLNIGHFSK
ncbi:unnamed protein product [Pleuronectes platessa]|uniref:Uncharacterized protein n=1 Tax=Pleuronectes platessa TaxID=8262 RepID=A0A9N7ZBZ3_PLEPL|nr:unnamed protein product [Pleuronectes platessa]